MKVETLVVGQLATNCYLVWCPETLEAIVIDPADAGDYIGEKVLRLNLKPRLIVATHGHFDHVLAVNELKLSFKIPFLIHKKDESILKRTRRTAQYFTMIDPGLPPKPDQLIKKGDTIEFGKQRLRVIETPGHTPGSICLLSEPIHLRGAPQAQHHLGGENVLFSGDTLFAGSVGRTDLSGGSQKELINSLKKLFKLPVEAIIYPGHGESSTIGEEKRLLKL